ncbi:MAG TPA: hypothetical protein VF518_08960, partial [Polyangia bacterium]
MALLTLPACNSSPGVLGKKIVDGSADRGTEEVAAPYQDGPERKEAGGGGAGGSAGISGGSGGSPGMFDA